MITVNIIEDKAENTVRFVCISDTHGKTNFDIPDGDVLSKGFRRKRCHIFNINRFLNSSLWRYFKKKHNRRICTNLSLVIVITTPVSSVHSIKNK